MTLHMDIGINNMFSCLSTIVRIPLDMAKAKNLVDNRVMGLLTPETSEQKGYIDPQTGTTDKL